MMIANRNGQEKCFHIRGQTSIKQFKSYLDGPVVDMILEDQHILFLIQDMIQDLRRGDLVIGQCLFQSHHRKVTF